MSSVEFLLAIIALEIPVAVALMIYAWTKDAQGQPQAYYPHTAHRFKMALTCGHYDEPFVVYPTGATACQKCHDEHASQAAS